MASVASLAVGDVIEQDNVFIRDVPYGSLGTVLAIHTEIVGPGDVTVRWDHGPTRRASGYHIRKHANHAQPVSLDLSDPDNVRSYLEE